MTRQTAGRGGLPLAVALELLAATEGLAQTDYKQARAEEGTAQEETAPEPIDCRADPKKHYSFDMYSGVPREESPENTSAANRLLESEALQSADLYAELMTLKSGGTDVYSRADFLAAVDGREVPEPRLPGARRSDCMISNQEYVTFLDMGLDARLQRLEQAHRRYARNR